MKRIQADLAEADINHDGRVDFEELKLILSKYPETFSPSQIEQVGELFFVGRAGEPVRHSTFLKGIQHILLLQQQPTGDSNEDTDPYTYHSKYTKHPLQMQSLDDNRCYVDPIEAKSAQEKLYHIQTLFEQSLMDYVREVKLLDQMGGSRALQRVADEFYNRATNDPQLSVFFVGADVKKLKQHPRNFMRAAFSPKLDPKAFVEKLQTAHASLMKDKGLNETHFDLMLEHFIQTLQDDGKSQETIDTATQVLWMFRDCFVRKEEEEEGKGTKGD